MTPLSPAPARVFADNRYAFGRYRGPVSDPAFPVHGVRRLRLKEWQYTSVVTERWLVAFAVVQLGYVASAFAYAVDRARPDRPWRMSSLSPLGRALSFAPSSVEGASTWSRGRDLIRLGNDDGWDMALDLRASGVRLHGELWMDGQPQGFALVRDLGDGRAAYTHKAGGMMCAGELRLGGERIDLSGGLGTVDWTRSLADRHTRWRWASLAGQRDGEVLALNLSTDVYGDDENFVSVDGDLVLLGGVAFEVPADPVRQTWSIRSREGDEVHLRFHPEGARTEDISLGLVRSRFVQPWGRFEGHVAGRRVDGLYGVVEDHDALW